MEPKELKEKEELTKEEMLQRLNGMFGGLKRAIELLQTCETGIEVHDQLVTDMENIHAKMHELEVEVEQCKLVH